MGDEREEIRQMPARITNAQLWSGQQQTFNLMRETAKRVTALEFAMHDSERDRKVMHEQIDVLKQYVANAEDNRRILKQLRGYLIGATPTVPLIVAIGHHFGVW